MPVGIVLSKRVGLGYMSLEDLSRHEYRGKISKNLVVYRGYPRKNFYEYVVIDTEVFKNNKFKIVAEVPLSKYVSGWHPDFTRVDSRYQGQKIGLKTYLFIIRKEGLVIRSGVSQSPGSQSLWRELSKRVNVTAYTSVRSRKPLRPQQIDLYNRPGSYMLAKAA